MNYALYRKGVGTWRIINANKDATKKGEQRKRTRERQRDSEKEGERKHRNGAR